MISGDERAYLVKCIEGGLRGDGRGCLDHRVVRLEIDTIPQATGSARVQLGGTDVMVGVKVWSWAPRATIWIELHERRSPDLIFIHCEGCATLRT